MYQLFIEIIHNRNMGVIGNGIKSLGRSLKSFALSQTRADGATAFVLKAGSSNNALYVYGGYEGKTMSGIKLNFDNSNKKLTPKETININKKILKVDEKNS